MTMLQLAGPPAATAFRLEKLRAELRSLAPTVTDVAVNFEHFVNLERPLTVAEQRVLAALLDYGGGPGDARRAARQRLYVVPRLGTISPWASKATDIAKLCALPVQRIERGRVVELARALGPDRGRAQAHRAAAARSHDGDAARRSGRSRSCCSRSTSRGRYARSTCSPAGAPRSNAPTASSASRCRATRSIISAAQFARAEAQSDRRRAHDVRAGELRALPPQDLQRRLAHRRRACAEELVRDDPEHARALADGRAVGLQGQRGRRRRRFSNAGSGPTRRPASTGTPRSPYTSS